MAKKLTRDEAIAVARNMARNNEKANAVPVAELAQMSYDARRALARALLHESAVGKIETRDNYIDACATAFVDAIQNIWLNKVRELENRRKWFKRACDGLTEQQARAKVVDLLTAMNVRGGRVSSYGDRFEIVRGRCGATAYIRIDHDHDYVVVNPDDESQTAGRYSFDIHLSVSGTTYSLAEMAVMNKVNAEMLDVVNEIAAVMASERIVWTRGMPEQQEVVDANAVSVS